MTNRRIRPLLWFVVFLAAGVWGRPDSLAAGAVDEAGALARGAEFARFFMAGEFDKMQPMMDAAMRDALGRGQQEEILKTLQSQVGKLKSWGDPWLLAQVPGFRVVRVPAVFEKGPFDLEVSVDPSGKVGGFFVRPFMENPARQKTAPQQGEGKGPAPKEIEVRFGPEGKELPGTLTLPEGKGPFPAVVLVHGSGPHDRDETVLANKPFRDLAEGLGARGVATLRYDMRTVARPDDFKAVMATLTVKEEKIDDAVAALAFLRTRPEVDKARLFVLGHSLGGTVAPRIARAEPRPAGIVLLAPSARPIHRLIPEQLRYIANLDGTVSAEEEQQVKSAEETVAKLDQAIANELPPPPGQPFGAPLSYWKDLAAHDPAAETAALGLPVLAIRGGRDYQVTAADFALFQKALEGKPFARVVVFPECDHLFRKGEGPSKPDDYLKAAPMDPRLFDDIAAWIKKQAAPK